MPWLQFNIKTKKLDTESTYQCTV